MTKKELIEVLLKEGVLREDYDRDLTKKQLEVIYEMQQELKNADGLIEKIKEINGLMKEINSQDNLSLVEIGMRNTENLLNGNTEGIVGFYNGKAITWK